MPVIRSYASASWTRKASRKSDCVYRRGSTCSGHAQLSPGTKVMEEVVPPGSLYDKMPVFPNLQIIKINLGACEGGASKTLLPLTDILGPRWDSEMHL